MSTYSARTFKQTKIEDTTESTTKDTGSLVVEGGVGVEKNISLGGNVNMIAFATVDGRDVSADGDTLDNLNTTIGLGDLTSAEVDQLENINSTTITATQWGYLGSSDQGIATTDTPSFTGLTSTSQISFSANWNDTGDETNSLLVVNNTNTTAGQGSTVYITGGSNTVSATVRNLNVTTAALSRFNAPLSTGNASGIALAVQAAAEGNDRIVMHTDAKLGFGSGSAVPDVFFRRSATNTITVANYDATNVASTGNLTVNGTITGNDLVIDNVTVNGNNVSTSSGNLSLLASGAILFKNVGSYINVAQNNFIFGTLAASLSGATGNATFGKDAFSAITSGNNNTAVGYLAGNDITTGSSNVVIGQGADAGAAGASNRIVIGQGASSSADNKVQIGNSSIDTIQVGTGNYSIVSGTNADISILPNGTGEVLLNADPTSNLGAATKQYVDNSEYVVFSHSFTNSNALYTQVSATGSYTAIGTMLFLGSTALGFSPDTIKIIESQNSGGTDRSHQWRVFDVTNSQVVAESAVTKDLSATILDLGTVSNIPTGAAHFQVQVKKTDDAGNAPPIGHFANARLHALQMYRS